VGKGALVGLLLMIDPRSSMRIVEEQDLRPCEDIPAFGITVGRSGFHPARAGDEARIFERQDGSPTSLPAS
jgi:hypothetical protein